MIHGGSFTPGPGYDQPSPGCLRYAAPMDDESLFAHHARFKADQEVPDGWYRQGESLGPTAWVVDLDLFIEITHDAATWEGLRGEALVLEVGETELELEITDDVTFEEYWTLVARKNSRHLRCASTQNPLQWKPRPTRWSN